MLQEKMWRGKEEKWNGFQVAILLFFTLKVQPSLFSKDPLGNIFRGNLHFALLIGYPEKEMSH